MKRGWQPSLLFAAMLSDSQGERTDEDLRGQSGDPGRSSGIGEAAALQFAREGATLVIAARRSDKSEQ